VRTLSVYWYFCQSQPLKPLNPLIRFPVTFDSGPLKIIMRTLSKILNGPSHVVEAIHATKVFAPSNGSTV